MGPLLARMDHMQQQVAEQLTMRLGRPAEPDPVEQLQQRVRELDGRVKELEELELLQLEGMASSWARADQDPADQTWHARQVRAQMAYFRAHRGGK